MSLDASTVDSCLTAKFGFTRDDGAKHVKFQLEVNGVLVARTVMSRSHRDLGDALVGAMARQVGVTSGQFRRMVDCRIDRTGYLALVL